MRKLTNKNIIISILALVVLIMTVAYAANNKQLDISGVSNIDSVWQVEVTNIETVTTNGMAKNTDDPYYEEATAYFSSSVSMPGDLIKYKITVSNLGTMDAKLISATPSLETDGYVDYEVTGIEPAQILKADETTDFYVSVFYDLNATGEPVDKKVYTFQLDLLYEQNVESGGTVVDTTKPTIMLASSSADGLNDWYKTEPEITVSTGDTVEVVSYTYCLTNEAVTCTPNVSVAKASGTISNTLEGENSYICAYSTSKAGVNSDTVCEGPYNTDFTAPKLNIPENKVIDITETTFDKMLNVSATDNITSSDDLNIIVTGDITFGTKGIYTLTYEVTDNVGHTTTKTRTVRVADIEQPQVTLTFDETQYNSNGWASNPTAKFTASDNSLIKGYSYCMKLNAECDPNIGVELENSVKETEIDLPVSVDGYAVYMCAIAFDDEGRTSDKVCVSKLKVDNDPPTIVFDEETTTIDTTVTSYDLMTGVTIDDDLTATQSLITETTGTLSLGVTGTYTITYSVTDLAGNNVTASRKIIIENKFLAVSTNNSTYWLNNQNLLRDDIESVKFTNSNTVPTDVGDNYWDASQAQNQSIMAWYYDNDQDGLYEVTVGQNGGVIANPNSSFMFSYMDNLTTVSFENFITSYITNMQGMFAYNLGLTEVDLSSFDTRNVDDMSYLFCNMKNVLKINVENFITDNVTDMNNMFSNVFKVTTLDLSHFNTDKVDNMRYMFGGMTSLTSLDITNFNTEKVTNMSYMFNSLFVIEKLDLSHFNTEKVTDMSSMFTSSAKLNDLNVYGWDTSKVVNFSRIFNNCTSLVTLDLSSWNTSAGINFNYMFNSASNLKTIYASNLWSHSSLQNGDVMFTNCTNLSGAITYDSTKVNYLYANYNDGYFTYKEYTA